jgi:hypothetical protein
MRHNPNKTTPTVAAIHDLNDEGVGRSKPDRIGNTVAAMARFMAAFPPGGRGTLRPGHLGNTA